ncbi:hypothetical protein GCK32_014418, partial [Trichostrongylus colubriformis]
MKSSLKKFENSRKRVFYKLGLSIGSHPWIYIIALLLFSAFSSLGFLRFHQDSSGHHLTYYNMCKPYCQKNEPITAFLDVYNRNFSRVD